MAAGPAPVPGTQAAQSWTSGAKDLVMTALGTSRLWATMARGIFTEIYWPAVDQPQVKDFGFLVAGPGWWQEVKRADQYTLATPEPGLTLPTITHAGAGQAYQPTLRPVADPGPGRLALGFGDSQDTARAAAQASLDAGYDATAAAFTQGWRAWMAGLTLPQLPAAPPGLGDALRESAVVLRTHADHTVDGAYVA